MKKHTLLGILVEAITLSIVIRLVDSFAIPLSYPSLIYLGIGLFFQPMYNLMVNHSTPIVDSKPAVLLVDKEDNVLDNLRVNSLSDAQGLDVVVTPKILSENKMFKVSRKYLILTDSSETLIIYGDLVDRDDIL